MRQYDPLAIGLVGTGLEENTPQVPGFAKDDSFPLPLSGRGESEEDTRPLYRGSLEVTMGLREHWNFRSKRDITIPRVWLSRVFGTYFPHFSISV